MRFPNPLNLLRRRGGGSLVPEDEAEAEDVEAREAEEEKSRVPATIIRPAPSTVTRPAPPVVKKSNKLVWLVLCFTILLLCVCGMFVYAALPEEQNPEIAASDATETVVVAIVTRIAQPKTVSKQTPANGQAVPTAVPTVKVTVNKTAPVSPIPKATATVTPTVVVTAYVPPWQREYDNNLEILGTLLCLAIPVVFCILLTAWLWRRTLPLPAKEVTTIFSYSQGNIDVKWSILAKSRARPLALLRARFLKQDSLSQIIEHLQTIVQEFGVGLDPNSEIRGDIIAFFKEFNFALKVQRQGQKYTLGNRRAHDSKISNAFAFIREALPDLFEEEDRLGIEIIEFFVADDCAKMSPTLQAYFAEIEQQKEEDKEAAVERARQLAEEQRLFEQSRRQAEEALRQMTKEAEEFVAQCNTIILRAGLKPESPQAEALIRTFTVKREAEIRTQAEERLARLRLDLDRDIAQRGAAAREREVEADAQRARAFAQFAEAVNKLASGLENFDLTELVKIAVSARQVPSDAGTGPVSARGDGNRANDRANRGG